MKMEKFDLPKIDYENYHIKNSMHKEIADELAIHVTQEDLDAISKLNEDQLRAFKAIVERVESKRSGLFFVDSPGGTGKTYLYIAILAYLRYEPSNCYLKI